MFEEERVDAGVALYPDLLEIELGVADEMLDGFDRVNSDWKRNRNQSRIGVLHKGKRELRGDLTAGVRLARERKNWSRLAAQRRR